MAVNVINKENFESTILNNKKVLLDFYADWCGPCKMLAPVINEIAEEYTDVFVGKVNVDSEPELASAFGVQSIPTLVVLDSGETVNMSVGYRDKNAVIKLLDI